jgi:hypothetical protein
MLENGRIHKINIIKLLIKHKLKHKIRTPSSKLKKNIVKLYFCRSTSIRFIKYVLFQLIIILI